MSVSIWISLAITCVCMPVDACASPGRSLSEAVRERVRSRIEETGVSPGISIEHELVHASVELPRFYERRGFEPAWSTNSGLSPQADSLVQAIGRADREGLRPSDYHLLKIKTAMELVRSGGGMDTGARAARLADLDLLLTDAFLIYASHLLSGRVNPETIDPEWRANRREADLVEVLERGLFSAGVAGALSNLLPRQPEYERMRQVLATYRLAATGGGWPKVPEGGKMERGHSGDRVALLRERLLATGDLTTNPKASATLFDEAAEQTVLKFQRRHGLEDDGIVGPATLEALNVSAGQRVRQIELNMERWRWLPQDLGDRHLLVNIAGFDLDVVAGGTTVLSMRVIVGRDYRRTPVFSDRVTYLVFSPYWHVPPSIAVQDILPALKKDPHYLEKKNVRVFRGSGSDVREVDSRSIDWTKVGPSSFNYSFRQDPGPDNALGHVKFMFPNKFNVYLHDTPARELFHKTERAFSSGCIRIEKPGDLAELLLRDDPTWDRQRVRSAMGAGVEQTVRLRVPVPIHVLYWTAWVGEDGLLHFRKDIYGRDRRLDEALGESPPAA